MLDVGQSNWMICCRHQMILGQFPWYEQMNFGVFSNTLQLSLSNSNFGNHNTMLDFQALHPHENEKRFWCNSNLTQWHRFVFNLSWSQHNLELSRRSYSPNDKLHLDAFYIKMANSSNPLRILLQHGTTSGQYSQKDRTPKKCKT